MKYKVVRSGPLPAKKFDNSRLYDAQELKEEFGLPYDVETIIRVWEDYSDCWSAGWLYPDKAGVESAFNVELEEIEDDN